MINFADLNDVIDSALLIVKDKQPNKFYRISSIFNNSIFDDGSDTGLINLNGKLNIKQYSEKEQRKIKIGVRVIFQYIIPKAITSDISTGSYFDKNDFKDKMNRAYKASLSIVKTDDKAYVSHINIIFILLNVCINDIHKEQNLPSQDSDALLWLNIAVDKIQLLDSEIEQLKIVLNELSKKNEHRDNWLKLAIEHIDSINNQIEILENKLQNEQSRADKYAVKYANISDEFKAISHKYDHIYKQHEELKKQNQNQENQQQTEKLVKINKLLKSKI